VVFVISSKHHQQNEVPMLRSAEEKRKGAANEHAHRKKRYGYKDHRAVRGELF
jgi:hypothetical protein